MNSKKDLDKETLYKAVKVMVESEKNHIHLNQQKLFTLFSVAFQYILFHSTKKPGHYIIRIEDSFLAEKLARKAKDESTRKFLQKLLVPRRLTYGNSMFHLDYFNLTSWGMTKDLPKEKIQAAIIVKNTSHNPLIDDGDFRQYTTPSDIGETMFGKDYYLSSLKEFVPKTIMIAFGEDYEGLEKVAFDFIEEKDETVGGVKLAAGLNFNEEE